MKNSIPRTLLDLNNLRQCSGRPVWKLSTCHAKWPARAANPKKAISPEPAEISAAVQNVIAVV